MNKQKETVKRLFRTAKEYYNLCYTKEKGKSKMEDKIKLTLACLNLKKIGKNEGRQAFYVTQMTPILVKRGALNWIDRKRQTSIAIFVFNLSPAFTGGFDFVYLSIYSINLSLQI